MQTQEYTDFSGISTKTNDLMEICQQKTCSIFQIQLSFKYVLNLILKFNENLLFNWNI